MALVPATDDKQYDDYKKDKTSWVLKNAPEEAHPKKEEKKDGSGTKK